MSHTSSLRLVSADEYYKCLQHNIPLAKKRIIISAMIVHWGGRLSALVPAIEQALSRGVSVRIVGDIYTKYEAMTSKVAKRGLDLTWKQSQQINQQLQAKGAEVIYFGKLGINPFKGRCHSKITIIDDIVYTFGGVNFSGSHIGYEDLMLQTVNASLAERLDQLVRDIEKGSILPDLSEQFGPHTLLFDGGTPGSSVIYQTALDMVQKAQKAYYVSKMCPTGKLAKRLNATESYCYFNRPVLEGPPENLAIIVDQRRYHIKNLYTRMAHIHAKFILCENHDGSRSVLTGSNNFNWRGIAFGTKEIAITSRDTNLWQQFYEFLQRRIANE